MLARIIVLSDTHKNQKLLRKAITNETEITHIFHLSDNYEDLDENYDLTDNKIITKVPGIFHPGYISKELPTVVLTKIGSWEFVLLHNLEDLNIKSSDLVLFGHTHKQIFFREGNVYFLNPGHLKNSSSSNQSPGYAVIEVFRNKLNIKLKNIEGTTVQNYQIERR